MAFERLDDKYIVFKSLSYGSIVVTHMALCCFLGQAMSEEVQYNLSNIQIKRIAFCSRPRQLQLYTLLTGT